MRKFRSIYLLILTLVGLFIILPTIAQDRIPPEILPDNASWSLPNYDYANTRSTTSSAINLTTVNQLRIAWNFSLSSDEREIVLKSNPIVHNGVVYLQDIASNVYALNFETGNVIWEVQYDSVVNGSNGVGIGYDKLFIASSANSFAALDVETGEELWTFSTDNNSTGAIQPIVYDDQVYFASQIEPIRDEGQPDPQYLAGVSGHIYALSQSDGSLNWQFQIVAEGFWGNPSINSGGGMRFSPAIDSDTHTTYWGTGNPAPAPGTAEFPNGSSREQPNLYTNSMIALGHSEGALKWYNHLNPDDLFGLDVQLSPVLATVTIDGTTQQLVIGSGDLGEIIALDRTTGEAIWRTAVGVHQNDDVTTIPENETITVYPGVNGGVSSPMAYIDSIIYAVVLNLPTTYSATGDVQETARGTGTSELVALDATTGEIYWNQVIDAEIYAGATVVNDLVITADYSGMIYAINRFTGEVAWSLQTPSGITAPPAIVEDTILFPAGLGDEPQLLALRLDGESSEVVAPTATVAVTATDVPSNEVTAEATEMPPTATPQSDETDQIQPVGNDIDAILTRLENVEGDASRGNAIFSGSTNSQLDETINCASCHEAGTFGPETNNLWNQIQNQRLSLDAFSDYTAEQYAVESIVRPDAYIVSGYNAGVMPGNFGEVLSTQDLADLIAYLRTLSDG